MILRHRLPWQTALLACRGRPIERLQFPIFRRNASYGIPSLTHEAIYEKEGIATVFSQQGYNIAWSQYQAYLLHNLNQMFQETPDLIKVIIRTARSADHADIFNFASMAHNNHFFFDGMHPDPAPMRPELARYVRNSFSSLESLRSTFIATANGMFGPGFVWLVKKPSNELAILTTYIAGTPYPNANYRRQPIDTNNITTNIPPPASLSMVHKHTEAIKTLVKDQASYAGYAGSFGSQSRNAPQWLAGNDDMEPLLAVSTWEHTFMPDWGAWGKRDFLEKWWDKIDWELVYTRTNWKLGASSSFSSPRF